MPVSDVSNIAPILNEVALLNPDSIIELGIGFGKYGVLLREVLEATYGRVHPADYIKFIWGVEAFKGYANPTWNAYDAVQTVDFTEIYEQVFGWDLVMMIDSLEHIPKRQAMQVLKALVANNSNVIISVPIGYCPQGPVFGNEYECHRAIWHRDDFNEFRPKVLYNGGCCVVLLEGSYSERQENRTRLKSINDLLNGGTDLQVRRAARPIPPYAGASRKRGVPSIAGGIRAEVIRSDGNASGESSAGTSSSFEAEHDTFGSDSEDDLAA